MIVESVKLDQFRNYKSLELEFDSGTNLFYGDNAQGKTNVLEAVYLCGTTRSHRFDFDPYVKGWQYGDGVFTTDDGDAGTQNSYYAIRIRIVYDDQCHAAWFDGGQLTKDEGGDLRL